MTNESDKEQLIASLIDRLNKSDEIVLLSKLEGQELREILEFYQKAKLLKSILSYAALFLAAYLAFKADILSWWGSDK